MTDLKSLTLDKLTEVIIDIGEKKFRAGQIYRSIHKNMVDSIDDMTSLSLDLRNALKENFKIEKLKIAAKLESKLDDTKKYLFQLEDGNVIESVFMKYKHGNTVCISTQVGCKMGCTFCASTKRGLVRDLSSGEILDQYYSIKKDVGENIGNIVLMGSGEPLDNFENLVDFLEIINSKDGQNISCRSITVSTCGIAEKIYELADLEKPVNLAISLHNPFEEERKGLMPIGNRYSISEIMKACEYYMEKTGRRVTLEYTLIENVNDSKRYADKLTELSKKSNYHINLIPLNEIKEYDKNKSRNAAIENFKRILDKAGVNSTIRRELGSDISAACGQLRIDYLENSEND